LLALLVAGTGTYAYLRKMDVCISAALLGAIAFVFSGSMMSQLRLNFTCWLPWGLWVMERAFKSCASGDSSSRGLFWLATTIDLHTVLAYPHYVYYSLFVYATYFVARLVHSCEHKRRSLLPVLQFTLAVVLGIGVAAIQCVPTYQLSTHSQRTGGVSFE